MSFIFLLRAAAPESTLVVSDPVQPHRWQPTRLLCPWDSPGKNTGMCCHFLLQCVRVKSESEVAQSCQTLATPWTAAYQAPPSMGFSRQEYWSGLPFPSPEWLLPNWEFLFVFWVLFLRMSKECWILSNSFSAFIEICFISFANDELYGLI